MYLKRKLEQTILDNLKMREYLAIVGPRQAGKTTLIQKIQAQTPDSVFLSFEDHEILSLFDRDIKLFAKEYARYKYIFIDEFQHSARGGKNLKYLYDLRPEFKLIITGSSAIDLTVKALRNMTGRIFIFNLYQLDFAEFLAGRNPELSEKRASALAGIDLGKGAVAMPEIPEKAGHELSGLLEEFMVWGGYPRLALATSSKEKENILKNIYNTYFLRDVRDIAGLADDYKLSRLIRGLAVQTGQMIEYSELGKISGYDYLSLKKYLNILEKTFICRPLLPFYRNKRTELVKNPKIYFFDNGLRDQIVGNFDLSGSRPDRGAVAENHIFTELVKLGLAVNYWRTKQKAEVDFIVTAAGNTIIPVEVKNRMNGPEISRSFRSFLDNYAPSRAVILNHDYIGREKIGATDVFFLPFWAVN